MKNFRHGDIDLIEVDKIEGEIIKHKSSFVLAEGETTGHKHVIQTSNPNDLEILKTSDGRYFFNLKSEGTVSHEEHNTIKIAPGKYEMKREREFDYFGMTTRKVID